MSDQVQRHRNSSPEGVNLLVVMPALNEQATVGDLIRRVPRDIDGIGHLEVLVVNDGSSDRTAQEAEAAGARVISHGQRCGVGAAFHTALNDAIARHVDLIVTIDSDGQFNPADIPSLIAPVVDGDADFATASRFKDPALIPQMPWVKQWGNRQMSRLISRLTGSRFSDVSCGMRCYNRRAMLSLNLMGTFTYTQEVFLNLSFKGLRIVEVPIKVRGEREFGKSRVAGSLWQYALNTTRIIFRAYRDYKPLRAFGGLAAGLIVPAFLLGAFLAVYYLIHGRFSPHKWAGFTAVALFVLALLLLHTGMIGDMLNRHRIYLEELLYHQRDRSTEHHDQVSDQPTDDRQSSD